MIINKKMEIYTQLKDNTINALCAIYNTTYIQTIYATIIYQYLSMT